VKFGYLFANFPSALTQYSTAPVTVTAVDLSQKILFAHILSRSRNLCKASASGHTRQMSASEGDGLMRCSPKNPAESAVSSTGIACKRMLVKFVCGKFSKKGEQEAALDLGTYFAKNPVFRGTYFFVEKMLFKLPGGLFLASSKDSFAMAATTLLVSVHRRFSRFAMTASTTSADHAT
jgi:hypothetical protein